jgi:hypothetical protein
MPSKTKNAPQFDKATFVSYTLSKEQRSELKATVFTLDQMDSQMLKLEEEGYKITFRPDDFNSCHAAWIIPTGDKHPNSGMILSGRGSTPLKALKQALYIHYQVFDSEWGDWRNEAKGEDLDD